MTSSSNVFLTILNSEMRMLNLFISPRPEQTSPTILANWLRDTWPFLNLFVSNLKIGDNINPSKAFYKVLSPAPPELNNVEVQKLYKIPGMCWTLDSQHCLGGGGGEDIIDVLLKTWLNVPNVLATIVGYGYERLSVVLVQLLRVQAFICFALSFLPKLGTL